MPFYIQNKHMYWQAGGFGSLWLRVGDRHVPEANEEPARIFHYMLVAAEEIVKSSIGSTDKTGKSWFTVGVSQNIIEASFKALIDSLEYKLFKEKAPANLNEK